MTKRSKANPPLQTQHSVFNPAFPPDCQASLTNTLQRSKRGVFPGYTKLQGKRSPPLFISEEIMRYAENTFSRFYPENVEAVRVALGLPKRTKSKFSPPELMEMASRVPAPEPRKKARK